MLIKSRQVLTMMKFDFKDTEFHVKVTNIQKIIYRYPIYVPKTCCEEKHIDLLLIEEKGKRHYVHNKDFNPLNCGRKHFRCCCLQVSSSKKH